MNFMNSLPFSGNKTYLLVAVAVILQGLAAVGYLDQGLVNQVLTYLGIGSVATIRHAVNKGD